MKARVALAITMLALLTAPTVNAATQSAIGRWSVVKPNPRAYGDVRPNPARWRVSPGGAIGRFRDAPTAMAGRWG